MNRPNKQRFSGRNEVDNLAIARKSIRSDLEWKIPLPLISIGDGGSPQFDSQMVNLSAIKVSTFELFILPSHDCERKSKIMNEFRGHARFDILNANKKNEEGHKIPEGDESFLSLRRR